MNSIDRNDSWNEDNDFLSGALHGAADKMPGSEVDDLHVSFGVVRDRVRRRRAAKIGGLTGASLALVGVLALGATQTALLDRAEPVPPGTSESATPDASPSPTPSGEPSPSGTPASSVIQDGYQPPWIADLGPDLFCGMPVEDMETTAPGWSVASAGDIYAHTSDFGGDPTSTSWGMAATVQTGDGSLDLAPVLVWSQDGEVVDLGSNVFGAPGPQSEPLIGAGQGAIAATGNSVTSCAPTEGEAGDRYETQLPEGDYEVRVVAFPEAPADQWGTTVVSEQVSVRLDADGAHSPTGTRGGDATIEPLDPIDGEVTRFELDRTTDWVTAEQTQRGYVLGEAMSVTTQCESTNPADTVEFELVRPSTRDVLGSGQITCDGEESVMPLGVLEGGEEVADIRLSSVPDGVARLWAVFAPGSESASNCSASGLDLGYPAYPASAPTKGAVATAQAIVGGARSCDPDRMIELATLDGTELMFGNETPEQVFGLPENETLPYETLVRLLAGTGVVDGGDPGNETVVWPRVATEEFRDSDEAWAEVVETGLLTQAEVDVQRADEVFGYTGMVIGIAEDGTWRYYSPTD